MIDLKILWETQIMNIRDFFYTKVNSSEIHAAIVQIDKNYTPLNLAERNKQYCTATEQEKQKIENWRRKELHGRHLHDLEAPHVDLEASNKWLQLGYLFPEIEGFNIAIQDQVIHTRNYGKYILKENIVNDKCRKCNRQSETIQHIFLIFLFSSILAHTVIQLIIH